MNVEYTDNNLAIWGEGGQVIQVMTLFLNSWVLIQLCLGVPLLWTPFFTCKHAAIVKETTAQYLCNFFFFFCFRGKASFFLPFVYYRFLTLRYASRRNPYCRYVWGSRICANVELHTCVNIKNCSCASVELHTYVYLHKQCFSHSCLNS